MHGKSSFMTPLITSSCGSSSRTLFLFTFFLSCGFVIFYILCLCVSFPCCLILSVSCNCDLGYRSLRSNKRNVVLIVPFIHCSCLPQLVLCLTFPCLTSPPLQLISSLLAAIFKYHQFYFNFFSFLNFVGVLCRF